MQTTTRIHDEREREREITNYNLKPKAYTLKRGNTFSRMQ